MSVLVLADAIAGEDVAWPAEHGEGWAVLEAVPYRAMARQHGVSRDSVARHVRSGHVPVELAARREAYEAARGVSLTARAEDLWPASAILAQAEGRPTVQLATVRELRAIVELLGKLIGAYSMAEHEPVTIRLSFSDGAPLSLGPHQLPPVEDPMTHREDDSVPLVILLPQIDDKMPAEKRLAVLFRHDALAGEDVGDPPETGASGISWSI